MSLEVKSKSFANFPASAFRRFESLPLLGAILFVFSTSFPPLDLLAQVNLAVHMGQHALIAFSGVLIAYPLFLRRREQGKIPRKNLAISSILVIAAIVTFWHLPLAWDAAVLNPAIHGVEHASFLAVGLLVGWFFPALPDNFKFMSVFLAASGHMTYGIYLFVMSTPVYPVYPVSQQVVLGTLILFPSPVYFIGLLVVSLRGESKRLEALEQQQQLLATGQKTPPMRAPTGHGGKGRLARAAVPLLTLLLIVIFAGYLIATAGAIYYASAAADPAHASSAVYIIETPVSWNYSPQNIEVVIGVNNTVVWVSHSLSEDTVTSATGLFDSGPVHPGGIWSYTFMKPGVYRYYCDFHPWMQGSVTVLAASS